MTMQRPKRAWKRAQDSQSLGSTIILLAPFRFITLLVTLTTIQDTFVIIDCGGTGKKKKRASSKATLTKARSNPKVCSFPK